jgi:hypothetical protein
MLFREIINIYCANHNKCMHNGMWKNDFLRVITRYIQAPANFRRIIFSSITNKIQRHTIRLFLQNALHVSGGSSAHHQELKNCTYSIGYLLSRYCYLTLSWRSTTAEVRINGLTNTRCGIYSFWAPDDGRKNRLKHIEHFAEINELCNVAACWLY